MTTVPSTSERINFREGTTTVEVAQQVDYSPSSQSHTRKGHTFFTTSLFVSLALLADYTCTSSRAYFACLLLVVVTSVWARPNELIQFAIVLFCLVPIPYFDLSQSVKVLNPFGIVMLIFVIKNLPDIKTTKLVLFLMFLVFLSTQSLASVNPSRSLGFLFGALPLMFTMLCGQELGRKVSFKSLSTFWMGASIGLSLLALAEYTLKTGLIFSSGRFGLPDYWTKFLWRWSVFRVTTSLGHPLNNALFFGTSFLVSLWVFMIYRKRRVLAGVSVAFAAMALLLTASRSVSIAVILGTLLVLLGPAYKGSSKTRVPRLALGLLVFALVYISPIAQPILERSSSSEGVGSSLYRFTVLSSAQSLLNALPVLGYGPGLATTVYSSSGLQLNLESSLLQMVLGVGFLQTIVFVTCLITFVWRISWRNALIPIAFPWISLFVTANFLESNSEFLTFFALFAVWIAVAATWMRRDVQE